MRQYTLGVEKSEFISSWYILIKGEKMPDPKDDTYYISADSRVSFTPEEAVSKSLEFESASNTGVGCNQAPENVVTPEN